MRITLRNAKKVVTLNTESSTIAIIAPRTSMPFMVEADINEGSPFILMADGKQEYPIDGLRITNKKKYHVKAFKRRNGDGKMILIPAHERTKPIYAKRLNGSI